MQHTHTLLIKGMVCNRCILQVLRLLHSLKVNPLRILLGEVHLSEPLKPQEQEIFSRELLSIGFDLVQPKETLLLDAFKQKVAELYSGAFDFPYGFRFSTWIEKALQTDYRKLSILFAEKECKTPEKYILEYRMQRVKECLVYTNATLEDLAFRFGFSSTAHLSKQFRQLTGLNASQFREQHKQNKET